VLVISKSIDIRGNVRAPKNGMPRRVKIPAALADDLRDRLPILTPDGARVHSTTSGTGSGCPPARRPG
jgi:hypothetical protein